MLEGQDIVDKIENVAKGARDKPKEDVKIVKSGELPLPDMGVDAEGNQIAFRLVSSSASLSIRACSY